MHGNISMLIILRVRGIFKSLTATMSNSNSYARTNNIMTIQQQSNDKLLDKIKSHPTLFPAVQSVSLTLPKLNAFCVMLSLKEMGEGRWSAQQALHSAFLLIRRKYSTSPIRPHTPELLETITLLSADRHCDM